MTTAQRRRLSDARLSDARFVRQVARDALRPPSLEESLHPLMCPRCALPMYRDRDKRQYPVYHCPNCATNWTLAIQQEES